MNGMNRKDGAGGVDRLWDSQWVNIVNAPEVLNAESQEDAVNIAVRMTEQKMAENARLREPAGVGGEFDAEAVAWAYGKLRDFGCYTREAGAMMGDRLNMMLLDPPAAPQPPAEAQAQGGGEVG